MEYISFRLRNFILSKQQTIILTVNLNSISWLPVIAINGCFIFIGVVGIYWVTRTVTLDLSKQSSTAIRYSSSSMFGYRENLVDRERALVHVKRTEGNELPSFSAFIVNNSGEKYIFEQGSKKDDVIKSAQIVADFLNINLIETYED
jgi:hypothetical protein